MSIVSDRLRLARVAKNLSQMDVMRITNINNKTLSGYENAVSEPDYESLVCLANLYDVRTDYLLGKASEPNEPLPVKPLYEEHATIALSRSDNPDDDLPEDALQQIEDFRAYIRQKYKKPD